jgi:beta-lactam-binding protein with PASTA domain
MEDVFHEKMNTRSLRSRKHNTIENDVEDKENLKVSRPRRNKLKKGNE